MKIYCVSIGEKYGPEFEKYLENKLGTINWIRDQIASNVPLQWNKMYPMSLSDTEPVCVIDLDIVLENDYMDLFNYPIERGEFLSIHGWWRDAPGYTLNGGFFKYYPIDCNYIYEKFMSDIEKWKVHYIKNKTTIGDNVFIGSNSSLVAPLTLEEGSTIGAGSVITKKVKRKSLALTRSPQTEIKNYKGK